MRKRRVVGVHTWRARRERFGEVTQWDTSDDDWTEGPREKMYLVKMIDEATSHLFARFVRHDSSAENMWAALRWWDRFGSSQSALPGGVAAAHSAS